MRQPSAPSPDYGFATFNGGASASRVGGRTIQERSSSCRSRVCCSQETESKNPRESGTSPASLPEMALAVRSSSCCGQSASLPALWAALRQPDVLAELRQLVRA